VVNARIVIVPAPCSAVSGRRTASARLTGAGVAAGVGLAGIAKEAGVAVRGEDVAARRVALAGRLAAELGELPAAVWQQRAVGSVESFPARISDDGELA
jgi:hypothetical protein